VKLGFIRGILTNSKRQRTGGGIPAWQVGGRDLERVDARLGQVGCEGSPQSKAKRSRSRSRRPPAYTTEENRDGPGPIPVLL